MKTLTGRWHGLYSYPVTWRRPVPFTADLVHADEWLTGSSEEVAGVGRAASAAMRATLTGRVTVRSVVFLKTYDQPSRHYDAVHYGGDIDQDGLEIDGRWAAGDWSGPFLMIRASETKAATQATTQVKLGERWRERVGVPQRS